MNASGSIQERSLSPVRWNADEDIKISVEMQKKGDDAIKIRAGYIAQIIREIAKIVVNECFVVKDKAEASKISHERPNVFIGIYGQQIRGFDRDEINEKYGEKDLVKKLKPLSREHLDCFAYLNGASAEGLLKPHTYKIADDLCAIENINHRFTTAVHYKAPKDIPFLKSTLLRSTVYRVLLKVQKECPETLLPGKKFWDASQPC